MWSHHVFLVYFCKKNKAIRRFSHIFRTILWTLIGFIVFVYVLLRIPAVQTYLGGVAASYVSDKIGSKVEIGRLNIGLSRITMDDVQVYDQSDQKMLGATRLSAKVELLPLFDGDISITSAQVFGLRLQLYRDSVSAPLNCQYALDSLRSKDGKRRPLHLSIRSLIVRNGTLRYDCKNQPTRDVFDASHLSVSDLSGHFILNELTDDGIDLNIKKLAFKERSGLNIRSLTFDIKADAHQARSKELRIELPNSTLALQDLAFDYQVKDGRLLTDSLTYSGEIAPSTIQLSDLAFFRPNLRTYTSPFHVSMHYDGRGRRCDIKGFQLTSSDHQIAIGGDATLSLTAPHPTWSAHLSEASVHVPTALQLLDDMNIAHSLPPQLARLGHTTLRGDFSYGGSDRLSATGHLSSDMGTADLTFEAASQRFTSQVSTPRFDLSGLLPDQPIGTVAADIQLAGTWPVHRDMTLTAQGDIDLLEYGEHRYQNVSLNGTYHQRSFDGTLSMDSPDGQLHFKGRVNMNEQPYLANLEAQVRHFSPSAFGLPHRHADETYDFDITADLSGRHLSDVSGSAEIRNFAMRSSHSDFSFNHLSLQVQQQSAQHYLRLSSDFADIDAEGRFDIQTLPASIMNIIGDQLPASPFKKSTGGPAPHNQLSLTADVYDGEWLQKVFKQPVTVHTPIHIEGSIDDEQRTMSLTATLPDISYSGQHYTDGLINLHTALDTIYADATLKRQQANGQSLDLTVHATASDNDLFSEIGFNSHGSTRQLRGRVSANTAFLRGDDGRWNMHVKVHESDLQLGNTSWTLLPSDILYADDQLVIDHFSLNNEQQQITFSGKVRPHEADSVKIDIHQVDLNYLSSLLNAKNVEFGGIASGTGYITSLYDAPEAACRLQVDHFSFSKGTFGDLTALVGWKKSDNKLTFDAIADNGPLSKTFITGGIILSPTTFDLHFNTQGTKIDFLEKYCGNFLCDIGAHVHGRLHLLGTFKEPNLEGQVVANGDIGVKSLHTTYTMVNDTIDFTPDNIYFRGETLTDRDGHRARLQGHVGHRHLGSWTYDLGVHADNMLVYDHQDYGGNTFCGTVYATGDCQIRGRSGEVVIDVNATPQKNTVFYYDVSSPASLKKQEFIHWNDVTAERGGYTTRDVIPDDDGTDAKSAPQYQLPADLHMNMLINATPDATLRLLMNAESGDYIALNGSGVLKANYFNKGAFNIFGKYEVDHGIYKMTIQNLIKKDFQFQPGGTIAFGGDPYDAPLDLKAVYTVNGVSLSDLNIGRNFTSNNVRVNCLMNIKGTANAPSVEFDMEMPSLSTDAQQMVHSLINSEEELNQQVIYLLTIGRFYSQNNTQMNEGSQSQTSLAMQSLLSGTISQQINNVLSSFINNSNWNFGANISTGDEGWNNAEYEGILSGRLLNNRLLINGQFGYRDNANATTSFIGDFDVRYLLYPSGNLAVRVYNQTNDRYFTKNSLNTQGLGLIMKKDFNGWRDLIGRKSKQPQTKQDESPKQQDESPKQQDESLTPQDETPTQQEKSPTQQEESPAQPAVAPSQDE